MAQIPPIEKAFIRAHASDKSYERGLEYMGQNTVRGLVWRDGLLEGRVEGSGYRPYRVQVLFEGERIGEARCSCPYDWGGWCKHIVAVLLTAREAPEEIATKPPLEAMLARQERTTLEAILLEIAARNPRAARLIERRCEGKGPPRGRIYRLR